MRIVPYIRVSTEEQARSGNGLEDQRKDIRLALERLKADLRVPVIEDDGSSAGKDLNKRPRLQEALEALRKGDALLVAHRDRLSRGDPVAMAEIEREVRRRGARILSAAGEGTDATGSSGLIHRRITDLFSEVERVRIAERTSAALQAKRARCEQAGALPFGWRLIPAGGRVTKRGRPACDLEPVPEEQAVLAEMRTLRAAGMSLRGIAGELTRQGIAPKRAKRWHAESIRTMLGERRREW